MNKLKAISALVLLVTLMIFGPYSALGRASVGVWDCNAQVYWLTYWGSGPYFYYLGFWGNDGDSQNGGIIGDCCAGYCRETYGTDVANQGWSPQGIHNDLYWCECEEP